MNRVASGPGRWLIGSLAGIALAAGWLGGAVALSARAGAGPDRSAVAAWVVEPRQELLLDRDHVTVRIRGHGPAVVRLTVQFRQPSGLVSRATEWKRVRISGGGVRTVRLRRTIAGGNSLRPCRRGWLVPKVALLGAREQRLSARALPRRLQLDRSRCSSFNPIAPWLPRGRKPAIFDLGQVTPHEPRLDWALDHVVSVGADTLRFVVNWRSVAPGLRPPNFDPADPGDPAYDFSPVDRLIEAATLRRLRLMLTISGPAPDWGSSTAEALANPLPDEFGQFALAVARRYNGAYTPAGASKPLPAAEYWSVWNEPNLDLFLRPQYLNGEPYSPILYRRLYLAAQAAIRMASPGKPILIGETAPFGADGNVSAIAFARGVLCLDAYALATDTCSSGSIKAAGWAAHPYTRVAEAPYAEPSCETCVVTLANLRALEASLDEAAASGNVESALPIFITEFGYQSQPDPRGIPLQTQADYLGISELIGYADERVASTAQYLMIDDPPEWGGGYRGFESGLRFFDGTAKPAYDAYRLPLVVRRRGEVANIWGLVRPARGPVKVGIWIRDAGGAPQRLARVSSSRSGVVKFYSEYREGRAWQLVFRDPNGTVFRGPWTGAYEFDLPGS